MIGLRPNSQGIIFYPHRSDFVCRGEHLNRFVFSCASYHTLTPEQYGNLKKGRGHFRVSIPESDEGEVVLLRCGAMPQRSATLLIEKLESVGADIEAIERLIASEPPQTTDQLLALRTIQELYRRLADDLRVAISLFE